MRSPLRERPVRRGLYRPRRDSFASNARTGSVPGLLDAQPRPTAGIPRSRRLSPAVVAPAELAGSSCSPNSRRMLSIFVASSAWSWRRNARGSGCGTGPGSTLGVSNDTSVTPARRPRSRTSTPAKRPAPAATNPSTPLTTGTSTTTTPTTATSASHTPPAISATEPTRPTANDHPPLHRTALPVVTTVVRGPARRNHRPRP